MTQTSPAGVQIVGKITPAVQEVLTPDALQFVADLHRTFNPTRPELLKRRAARQKEFDQGVIPGFLPETAAIRSGVWQVGPAPADLNDRRVEITGPTERKMMINALNSGAKVFMADFEDALSPTWENVILGQINCSDAIRRTISFANPDGKTYKLNEVTATLLVRPRGWHLVEKHVLVDGEPISGSLFDFGLYMLRNAQELLDRGSGPYFYLPKLESHVEARLWNDVFNYTQDKLGIARGTVRATVLIETILGALEMEEILYELREHSAGLNAGRWDYIFSAIKKFAKRESLILPDRVQVTMTVPFMRAYTELLVRTCHKRGAHAIGGDGGLHPQPPRPGGDRKRAGQGARGQAARVRRRLRRHLDRPSRPLAHGARSGQQLLWRQAQPEGAHARGCPRPGQPDHRRGRAGRQDHGKWPAHEHQRGAAIFERLAPGQRRRGDPQPHGGCGHGRDLPLADSGSGCTTGPSWKTAAPSPAPCTRRSATRNWPNWAAWAPSAMGTPSRSWTNSASPTSSSSS